MGKDSGPPGPRQRGDPRAPSCWEVSTGPRRLPGPSRAGLVTFWASCRAYRPLWQGAQEAACCPAPNPPHRLKEPPVWAVPLPPSAPARGWGARVDTAVPRLGCRGPHTIRQGGPGGLGARCRGREEAIGPGQGAEARRGALGQLRVSGQHLLATSPGTATRPGAMPRHATPPCRCLEPGRP